MALIEFENYPSTNTAINATNLNNNFNELLNLIFPIGRGFIDFTNTDYTNYLGFTWERELLGKVPVGIDSNDTDFNTIGKTGGKKEYTLTVNEIPSHEHSENITSPYGAKVSFTGYYAGGNSVAGYCFSTNSGIVPLNQTRIKTDNAGGGQPHNNLQPYITVYMWKRTK